MFVQPPAFLCHVAAAFFWPKVRQHMEWFSAEGWELVQCLPLQSCKTASQILTHGVNPSDVQTVYRNAHEPTVNISSSLATQRSFEHDNMRSRAKTFQEKMSYLSRTFLTEWDFASSICPFWSGWKESQTTPGIALYRQLIWLNSQKLHPKTCHFQTEVQKSKFSMFTLGRHVHWILWFSTGIYPNTSH